MENTNQSHIKARKRIMRYVTGTKTYGIIFWAIYKLHFSLVIVATEMCSILKKTVDEL